MSLVVEIPRVQCCDYGSIRQIDINIARPRKWHTKIFERFVLSLYPAMSLLVIARFSSVGWGAVKDIVKRDLAHIFVNPPLKYLHHIAIDEISTGKRHRYLIIVLDLKSGAVVFVGDSKGTPGFLSREDSNALKPE